MIPSDAAALRRAYARGSLSPVEVTRVALARIAARDAALNAFLFVDEPGALAAARASHGRWARGAPIGLLDGIPVSVKDQLDTVGVPTRKGSRTTPDEPAEVDAPAVARLREAGAVILGKTAMCEFGWKGVTDSPLLGVTRNPWNPERSAGGSSGGAAVAAACGMGVIHLGTDGAGSVRIPAAFCGVFGFKPSFGRVPHAPGGRLGLGHVGPITRSVADAALALCAIAKPDERDTSALPHDPRDWRIGLEDGVAGWRIAYARGLHGARAEREVLELCDRAVERLAALGATVERVEPRLPDPRRGFGVLWHASMGHAMAPMTSMQRDMLDPGYRAAAEEGLRHDAAAIFAAMGQRQDYARALLAWMRPYDLLVTPQMPVPAIEAGRDVPQGSGMESWLDWSPFTYGFNWTGQPAASVPVGLTSAGLTSAGLTSAGLPVALQLVGQRFDDAGVLRASRALEHALPFRFPEEIPA